MQSHDLAPSLEEFGLSRYETKAYLTLLSKGTLSASELAYYADLPRTKVYSTLTKLSKKGLVMITQEKPLICTAVSPDDAFGELLSAQESKIGSMKSMVAKLQTLSEESNKANGVEEHKYLVLDPDSVLATVKKLILDASEEIACSVDAWGLKIISQCKDAVLKSVSNKINVKILISKDCLGNNILPSIPYSVSLRAGDSAANLFLIDSSTIVMVNSSNGKGLLFKSVDILNKIHGKMFDIAWASSVDRQSIPLQGTNR